MTTAQFSAPVLLGGKTATGIPVPPEALAALGAGGRPAVRVTIGQHTYRSTLGVMGGQVLIPLSAENRSRAGVAAGDEVDVCLELDREPREVSVPADFAAALDAWPAARRCFDALSYSQKRWYVLPIEEAKTAATRERRITKAVERLTAS